MYRLTDEVPPSLYILSLLVVFPQIAQSFLLGCLCFVQHAEDLLKEHTRKLVEENIASALSIVKSRARAVYDLYFFAQSLFVAMFECQKKK